MQPVTLFSEHSCREVKYGLRNREVTVIPSEVVEYSRFSDIIRCVSQNTLFATDLDNAIFHPKRLIGADEWFEYMLGDDAKKK